ncbi:RyR domain-containing protein [Nonomuraea sp. NPDC049421]|uniref:RyR domain-containing protein n=1 Tax=Nonomuraea sp. NPDC049421 TaxID=3155275 RepID=UPI00341646CE
MRETGSIRSSVMAGFGFLALVSLVLGFMGLRTHLAAATPAPTLLDLVYYDLQLFVIDPQPLGTPGPLPWPLEVARFTAPAVTIYALAETVRLLLGAEYRRLRAREASGHAVVCGTGPLGQALTQRLRENGRTVVVIGGPAGDPQRARGVFHVAGDARNPQVLRAAGAHRARVVYACEDDATANVAIAAAAHGLGSGSPVSAYAYVPDPGLCSALRARRLGSEGPHERRLDFFNLEELAARVLLLRDPVTHEGPVLLLGLRHFGAALLVELARQCRLRAGARVPVRVLAPGATAQVEAVCRTYPFVADHCAVTAHDAGADGLRPFLEDMKERPQRVYVCYGDEDDALTATLTVAPLWTGAPMIVRVGQRRVFAEAFGTAGLLDDVAGTLRFFAVTEEAGRPDLIDEDVIERLARAIHERYLMGCAERGETPEQNESMVPYEALTEAKKGQNRDQAAHIGIKLRVIGAVPAPSTDAPATFAFEHDEIELLAELEHRRWMSYLLDRGWTHGPTRDDARKQHPDLLDWEYLSEEARGKDRAAVTGLPALLEDAGFRIVRVPPENRRQHTGR